MRMGMRMRVRVDGGRRRWRKSLMKTSGHADTRVIHVMLHRRMHRVMMLRRTWNDNAKRRLLKSPCAHEFRIRETRRILFLRTESFTKVITLRNVVQLR